MGCCGQKRAALRTRHAVAVTPPPNPAPAPPPPEPFDVTPGSGEVAVAYRGSAAALLHRGPSGRLYTFSAARPVRAMAREDAEPLAGRAEFELRGAPAP